jgi:hypothetical protein
MNPKEERLDRPYDIQKWAEKAIAGKRLFIIGFFMSGKEIPGWNLIKVIPEQIYKKRRTIAYLWQRAECKIEELIRIDIVESGSWQQSHEALLELLEGYQAPRLPEATSKKIELGDVAYTGFGEIIQSVVFVRANMIIRIHSVGKQNVSVIDIGKQLDNLLITKPLLSEKGVIPKIEMFLSDKPTVRVNEVVTLNMKAEDPLGRPLWYKLMVDQGEFFIKDEKVYFLSERPWQIKISLFVINETNFVSGATLSINVE